MYVSSSPYPSRFNNLHDYVSVKLDPILWHNHYNTTHVLFLERWLLENCNLCCFKGALHLQPQKAPKLACFVLYLKIINIFFWKMIYSSYSKLSKELKNSIKIKAAQAVLELLIRNQHFYCFDL